MTEQRIYDQWAGNPKGIPEDKSKCFESVSDGTGFHFYQCRRKRGHGKDGLYCKQHAKRHPASEEKVRR
jgi:hypothetical protein